MRTAIVLFFLCFVCWQASAQTYFPDRFIIKVKPDFRTACSDSMLNIENVRTYFNEIGVRGFRKMFPNATPIEQVRLVVPQGQTSDKRVDLSLIFTAQYDAKIDPYKVCLNLKRMGYFEYAEPWFIPKVALLPSDQLIDSMYYLPMIKAFEAWDIDTGSSDVVIAIVDTGVDFDHPDLKDKLWKNEAEIPGNGADDDDNGFVDDTLGWNFYEGNNAVNETGFSHGTHVAGLAGAKTNNQIGVAGAGWASTIMAIKSGDKLILPNGYEGIVYAADHGADIINCSWGGFNRSDFAHDIIKYATYNHDALVIAAAGNDNRENLFYPAAFPEVLSVAASNSSDLRAAFSNYNYQLDIIAPGEVIFNLKNDGYGYDSGTSMATPLVSGAAALVRNRFNSLNALQVGEQLRNTANPDIYQTPGNEVYAGKLGTGRLDMEAALLGINSPGLRIENATITDRDDEVITEGEVFYAEIELTNYLNDIQNVVVTIESMVENVTVVSDTWNAGDFATFESKDNVGNGFVLRLEDALSFDQEVPVRIKAQGNVSGYEMVEYLTFIVNPSYVHVVVNDVKTTVNKHGLFGYTDYFQNFGLGFRLDTLGSLLYEGGLMVGHEQSGASKVVDRLRNGTIYDRDFWELQVIDRKQPPNNEAFYASGVFSDSGATLDKIGLTVRQQVRAFTEAGHRNYVLLEYTVKNESGSTIENAAVGLFADWDVIVAEQNKAFTAYGKRLGYVQYTGTEKVCGGIQLLSDLPFQSYMIDNEPGGNGGIDMYDSTRFDSPDKLRALTSDRPVAGDGDKGRDVIQVAAASGLYLEPGDSVHVVFAVHAALTKDAILKSADAAFKNFHGYLPGDNVGQLFEIVRVFPNPNSGDLRVDFNMREKSEVHFQLFNAMGRMVFQRDNETFYAGFNRVQFALPSLEKGIYYLRIHAGELNKSRPILYMAE